jgi:amino acid transporter
MAAVDKAGSSPKLDRRGSAQRGAGLGPVLCWAIVFADIGTSVYYTPGILFGRVGNHAALFVGLTLIVFVLLTIKYSEVSIRYPQGGGVVTVAADAANNFVGLVGGLLILVDYFLTAALSALSGLIYLTVIAPDLKGTVVALTVTALILIAILNLMGISANARITAVVAAIAISSQLAVIIAVLVHVGIGGALAAVPKAVSGPRISGVGLVTGYAGAFLAFSGLESISQLAPAMAPPNRRTAPRAMLLVVITVAITSPLLTLWSTTLLNPRGDDPNQLISLLGGFAAGPLLQFEVAASAALLLVFASNTAIIGSYHVFWRYRGCGSCPRRCRQGIAGGTRRIGRSSPQPPYPLSSSSSRTAMSESSETCIPSACWARSRSPVSAWTSSVGGNEPHTAGTATRTELREVWGPPCRCLSSA